MASMVLGSIGSSMLGPLGGFLGSALGSYIDNLLFSSNEPQEGPRIDDLSTTPADPGSPIPIVYGGDRIPGIICATTPLIEKKHKEKIGKGGGSTVITYTYSVDIDYLLCQGPILGVGRIWADGNCIRGPEDEMETDTYLFPENIGGIPYAEWYRDHAYDPAEIPRSITDINGSGIYHLSSDGRSMLPGPAQTNLGQPDKRHDYTLDLNTGLYIPTEECHRYTGEKHKVDSAVATNTVSATLGAFYEGDDGATENHRTILSFDDVGDDASLNIIVTLDPTVYAQFGLSAAYCEVGIKLYAYDDNGGMTETEDYLVANTLEGTSAANGESLETLKVSLGATSPAGGGYAVVTWSYAVTFPLYADFSAEGEAVGITMASTSNSKRVWTDYWNLYSALNDWSKVAVLGFDQADGVKLYHGHWNQWVDGTMDAADLSDEVSGYPAYVGRAHIVFDHLQLEDFGNRIPNMTFEVVHAENDTIKTAVADLMNKARVDEQYYNLDECPDHHILGYTIGRKTSFRAAMETLLEAFRVDAAEIGTELYFRGRDRLADAYIDYNDLGATDAGSDKEDRITYTYRDKVEMPKRLTAAFKDADREYQQNTMLYTRSQGISVNDTQIEVAAVIPAANVKKYVRDKMRDLWLERVSVKFSLPPEYSYLAVSDIVVVTDADSVVTNTGSVAVKITNTARGANGVIEVEGVVREELLEEEAALRNNIRVDNVFTGRQTYNSTIYGCEMYPINLPALEEPTGHSLQPAAAWSDDAMYDNMYMVIGTPSSQWSSASLYQLDRSSIWAQGQLSEEPASTVVALTGDTDVYQGISLSDETGLDYKAAYSTPTVVGLLVNVIDPADDATIDYINDTQFIDVSLNNADDEFESVDADDFFNGVNTVYINGELICFANAEKLDDVRWRLSKLLRGRKGTEYLATSVTHTVGDRVILVQQDVVQEISAPSNVGTQEWPMFQLVSYGDTLADHQMQSAKNRQVRTFTFEPVWIGKEAYNSADHDDMLYDEDTSGYTSDDWVISWVRQDRLFWSMFDYYDLPMTEVSKVTGEYEEKYEVKIYDVANDTYLRSFIVDGRLDANGVPITERKGVTYTVAMRSSDGVVDGETELEVHIHQVCALHSYTIGGDNIVTYDGVLINATDLPIRDGKARLQ